MYSDSKMALMQVDCQADSAVKGRLDRSYLNVSADKHKEMKKKKGRRKQD